MYDHRDKNLCRETSIPGWHSRAVPEPYDHYGHCCGVLVSRDLAPDRSPERFQWVYCRRSGSDRDMLSLVYPED